MDSQGLRNPIENFTIRFASLTNLQQPDFQMTSQILTEKVKSTGSEVQQDVPKISTKADVTARYLEGTSIFFFAFIIFIINLIIHFFFFITYISHS